MNRLQIDVRLWRLLAGWLTLQSCGAAVPALAAVGAVQLPDPVGEETAVQKQLGSSQSGMEAEGPDAPALPDPVELGPAVQKQLGSSGYGKEAEGPNAPAPPDPVGLAPGEAAERSSRGLSGTSGLEQKPAGPSGTRPRHRLGIGLEMGTSRDAGGTFSTGLTVSWALRPTSALQFGLGNQVEGGGLTLWAHYVRRACLLGSYERFAALETLAGVGLAGGFLDPGFYVRNYHTWTGYDYYTGGPAAISVQVPIGVNVRLAHGRIDTYFQMVPMLILDERYEVLVPVTFGMRYYF